jgi:DNA-binding NarL/FixJ family response regulator
MIRVLIVDDHPVVREGLRAVLDRFPDCEVAGEAGTADEAVAAAARVRPDLALVDLRLAGAGASGGDGVAAVRQLAPTPCVILSAFRDEAGFLDAMAAGARGYILKGSSPEELHRAVRDAAAGGMPVDPALAPLLLRRDTTLSPREREVLQQLADGLANKEVADRLGMAESTVKTHLESIYRKLEVFDRTAAVTEGLRRGLVRLRGDGGA